MYSPMVAIDVAAEKATVEPSDGMAKMNDSVAASQTVRIGDLKRASTLWKNGCFGARLAWVFAVALGQGLPCWRVQPRLLDLQYHHLAQRRTSCDYC